MVGNTPGVFNITSKKKGLKIKQSSNKGSFKSPMKLDKNLQSIENRILAKMRNKNKNQSISSANIPNIEKEYSPMTSVANMNLHKVKDYGLKGIKKNRYSDHDDLNQSINDFERPKGMSGSDKGGSYSIRNTVAGPLRSNGPDSVMKSMQVPRPIKDQYSEYDMYNSYGSSNGFIDEKQLSNKMKNNIKASFGLRDEIDTADTDCFFSSKFSGFTVSNQNDSSYFPQPSLGKVANMTKKKHSVHSKPANFPNISKNVPASVFSLPALK
jgi:hypothetical protein